MAKQRFVSIAGVVFVFESESMSLVRRMSVGRRPVIGSSAYACMCVLLLHGSDDLLTTIGA